MNNSVKKIKALVAEQSDDELLWSLPVNSRQSIAEAHLQEELRRLHEIIEQEFGANL